MRKKKKVPTLPYNVTPIIPDKVDGLDNLNANMDVNMSSCGGLGEELKQVNESTQNKLSAQDKNKLEKFVQDNDDIDEIKTYLSGLLNKNESLKEWLEDDDEAYEEYEENGEDCNYNLDGKLPDDVQTYLDELTSGVWIEWGQLPSGICFFSDEGDVVFYSDLDDFVKDMRYNIEQWRESYRDNQLDPEDYSVEFINLMENSKEVNEAYLKESDSYLPPDVHYSDDNPRSPFYNGPDPEDLDFNSVLEVEFSQRGVIKDGFWEPFGVGFDDDSENIDYIDDVDPDNRELGTLDSWQVLDALVEVYYSPEFQSQLPLDTPDVYKVSGYVEIPYEVEGAVCYRTYDKRWGEDVEYDNSSMRVSFDPDNAKITKIEIERMSF